EILPGDLQRSVHLLRSAASVKDARQPHRRVADQIIGQRFSRLAGVKHHVGELEFRDLILNGLDHRGLAVAQAGDARAAASVKITIALAVNDVRAVAFDGDRKLDVCEAWKDVTHLFPSKDYGCD